MVYTIYTTRKEVIAIAKTSAQMKEGKYFRMTLIIDPKLRQAFRLAAMRQGKNMTQVLLQFIEQYTEQHAPDALAKKKGGR